MCLSIISLCLILLGLAAQGNGCSCRRQALQTHFCQSDYVMQIRVRKVENLYSKEMSMEYSEFLSLKEKGMLSKEEQWQYGEENKYMLSERLLHVVINRIFKVENNTAGLRKNSTVAILHTPPNDGLCGVYLEKGTKFLVGGSASDDKLSIMSCNLVQPWPHVTKRQKKNLLALYGKSCECKIVDMMEKTGAENECVIGRKPRMDKCYQRYSACIVNKNSITGSCKWHKNKHLRGCKADARKPQLP